MYKEIIELLPSKSLKNKIFEAGHTFTEAELVYIIYEYAKTLEQRKEMLRRFAESASAEIAKNARMLADRLDEIFEDFCNNSEGYVYELRTKEEEYCEQRFICSSYQAAIKYIDLYYDEYAGLGVEENEKTRYHIVKRRVYTGDDSEGFCEDHDAECILGAGKVVISIDDTRPICNKSTESEKICVCTDCKLFCPSKFDEILFPCFVKDGDIIKYTELVYPNELQEQFPARYTEEHYGIAYADGEEAMDNIYTIPLDSPAIRKHRYDDISQLESHTHVLAPLAELVSIDELSDEMKEDYMVYMEYSKNN